MLNFNKLNELKTVGVILTILILLACTKSVEEGLNANQVLIGKWQVIPENPSRFYPKDTIFSFMDNHLLLIRKNVKMIINEDSTVMSELWYYTHWWIDESNLNLVYPRPYSGVSPNTPFEQYFSEYGRLAKLELFDIIDRDIVILKEEVLDSSGVLIKEVKTELRRVN